MVDYESPKTKLALVLAAGELFSQKGLDGVTVREIAKKAGAKLGSIHYYFTSKKNLYLETFRYTLEKISICSVKDIIKKNSKKIKSPEELAHIIWQCVQSFLSGILISKDPEWGTRLILREMMDPSFALPILIKEIFRPGHDSYVGLYEQVYRDKTDFDYAHIWAFFLSGQALLYDICFFSIEQLLDKKIDDNFVHKIINFTAKVMILALNLPLPEELINDEKERNNDAAKKNLHTR